MSVKNHPKITDLICLVQDKPCIYVSSVINTRLVLHQTDYKKTKLKDLLWAEISEQLNEPGKEIGIFGDGLQAKVCPIVLLVKF